MFLFKRLKNIFSTIKAKSSSRPKNTNDFELGEDHKNKIFGVGPKGFRFHCRKVDYNPKIGICSTHPHNISIQSFSEKNPYKILYVSTSLEVFTRESK